MHSAMSKALGFLAVPSNIVACLAVMGVVLLIFHRFSRLSTTVVVIALTALVAATLSPIGNVLLTPLEQRFPAGVFPDHIDGIIVLGGSYDTISHGYLSTIVLNEDTEPMAVIPDLARRYPRAQIIFSGGTDPSAPSVNEAAIVKQYFVSFGIVADRIAIEDRSLTTAENARFTAQMVRPTEGSRWLLVTSAYHIPRAMGAFQKAGLNVIAFPVGARTHGWEGLWWPAATATENLRRIDVAAHEWLGLLAYRLSGYSDHWFPGP